MEPSFLRTSTTGEDHGELDLEMMFASNISWTCSSSCCLTAGFLRRSGCLIGRPVVSMLCVMFGECPISDGCWANTSEYSVSKVATSIRCCGVRCSGTSGNDGGVPGDGIVIWP